MTLSDLENEHQRIRFGVSTLEETETNLRKALAECVERVERMRHYRNALTAALTSYCETGTAPEQGDE